MASMRRSDANYICCKYHPEALLIEDYSAGDQICSECGLVVGDRVIDVGAEWRNFDDKPGPEKENSRVGPSENPLLNGSNLSTTIRPGKSQGRRGEVSSSQVNVLGVSRYQNRKNISGPDRALTIAFREISEMANRIHLPRCIIDRANNVFKQVHENGSMNRRSTEAKAAACLYIACRQEGVPRTFKEICALGNTCKREIGRCFKLILKELNTSVDMLTTGDFMPRFCANLNLHHRIQKAATHIAKKAVDMDIVNGRSPISVVAAAIYMATQVSADKRTPKQIGLIAGTSHETIRQCYTLLYPHAVDLFPKDFNFVTPIHMLPKP